MSATAGLLPELISDLRRMALHHDRPDTIMPETTGYFLAKMDCRSILFAIFFDFISIECNFMPTVALDKIDRAILAQLQVSARISNVELANRVGLSQSACLRRVDALEKSGVIEGYHATVSDRALGQTITAIIQITLSGQSEQHLSRFEAAIARCPFVVACFMMSGDSDYVVRVTARDMEHFEHIHKHWLSTMPGVTRIHSSFAMRTVVNRANVDIAKLD